jgi:hypothetical protein
MGSSSLANGYGDPLYDPAVVVARRILPIIDGEVTTDEIGPHGCIFPSQGIRVANNIRLVLAVVDTNNAGVSRSAGVGFVDRLRPVTASAETCTMVIGYWTWDVILGVLDPQPETPMTTILRDINKSYRRKIRWPPSIFAEGRFAAFQGC